MHLSRTLSAGLFGFHEANMRECLIEGGIPFQEWARSQRVTMDIRTHNQTWQTLLGEGLRWGVIVVVSVGALLVLAKYIG